MDAAGSFNKGPFLNENGVNRRSHSSRLGRQPLARASAHLGSAKPNWTQNAVRIQSGRTEAHFLARNQPEREWRPQVALSGSDPALKANSRGVKVRVTACLNRRGRPRHDGTLMALRRRVGYLPSRCYHADKNKSPATLAGVPGRGHQLDRGLGDVCANDNAQAKSGQGVACFGGEAAGLVPYTTTQTQAPDQRTSTVFALQQLLTVSAAEARLKRLKHHVRTASRLIKETMARSGAKWRAVFVTLTYRDADQWRPNHIRTFLDAVRKWGERQGVKIGYVWVAEMQKRGVIHYHAVIWIPSRLQLPRPDKRGWWRHGSTNVQAVKRNAIGYLMKYVSKGLGDSPDLPQGARVCGSGGLDVMARNEFHYWRLPRYVRENIAIGDRCSRVVGGGWMSRATGEVWRSEFGVFAHSIKSRGKDCNGRKLRDDNVVLLSDRFKREKAVWQSDPLLWDLIKERDWEKQRARESIDAAASESVFWYESRSSFVGSGARYSHDV